MSVKEYDCVVIGGGMIGATAALSLAQLGLSVAVVERAVAKPFSPEQDFDLRVSAISLASQHLLEQVSAWQQIKQWRVCPYRRLGVWEQAASYTEFCAQEIGQQYLGHFVENRLIQLALFEQLSAHQNITLFCPDFCQDFQQDNEQVIVSLTQQKLKTKLLIAADGPNSQIRKLAGIGTTGWDYPQSAMLINVKTEHQQQDITWQQFKPSGPVAMLPLPGENASLVWYHHRDHIKQLNQLSNSQLEAKVFESFPERLGGITVLNRASFPLVRRHANNYFQNRVVLLGDAAHAINPLAGQGVNLGFKDVKVLQTLVAKAIGEGRCWHDIHLLKKYEQLRRYDNLLMMTGIDAINTGFSHPSHAIKMFRNSSLMLINQFPAIKRKALAYACGL
jgi:2-octaprenyl-3-methyl-6-methoxy-1,4-benzoquinol hydroxylase